RWPQAAPHAERCLPITEVISRREVAVSAVAAERLFHQVCPLEAQRREDVPTERVGKAHSRHRLDHETLVLMTGWPYPPSSRSAGSRLRPRPTARCPGVSA